MAASFTTLPLRLIPASVASRPKQQHQQLFTISSSLSATSNPTRLPAAWFGFGSSSSSPVIRSKLLAPNSTSDDAAAEASVQTLENEAEAEASEDDAGEEQEEAEAEAEAEAEEEAKPRGPPIVKLGDIMGILNKRAIEAAEQERPVPDLRTGDIVEIKLEVPENRRRASIYKGIVISKQNAGIHTTIRIRRIIAGIGVEIVFPVYSPNIKEIKVVKHRKVRRARLYYLRDKLPRLSTFK